MASIILSFVGKQDPYSDNTMTEGSIVTLVRHLLHEQCEIARVILLYTADTEQGAIETREWLSLAPLKLDLETINLFPVDAALSDDPVNLLLAVQTAKDAVDFAKSNCTGSERLEFNASSGTPVMKSTWSILQAAGYVPHSRVWQIRNPKEMQPGQERIFQTNVNGLKNEFDLKVIKQQMMDYNYSGALETLRLTSLNHVVIEALLQYAHCRFSLDFDSAYSALAKIIDRGDAASASIDCRWNQEISRLRQKKADRRSLLREAYFNTLIESRNQQYADFLVKLSRFQEGVLNYLVSNRLGRKLPEKYEECEAFWQFVRQFEQGQLYAFLQTYRFRGNALTLQKFPNRPTLMAILEYDPQFAEVLKPIRELSESCDRRNKVIHNFEGVSRIEDAANLLQQMRQILRKVAPGNLENPFDELNQQIGALLDTAAKSALVSKPLS